MGVGLRFGAPAVALVMAAAPCAAQSGESRSGDAGPIVLAPAMRDVLGPESARILDLVMDALDDPAEPAVDWLAIGESIARMRDVAVALRDRPVQVVSAPGDELEGEGEPGGLSAAEVQARLEESPAEFRLYAAALLSHLEGMAADVEARDARRLTQSALDLDGRCIACHGVFWYEDEGELPPP